MATAANITIIKAPVATTFDTIGAFKSIALSLANIEKSNDVIETMIAACRENKVVVGKTKKDATCAQLLDALKEAFPKRSEKTLANYMTALRNAINDGVPFSKSASKGKAGGKKDGGKKAAPEFSTLVAKLFNHPDFEEFCNTIQSSYEDADGDTVLECVRQYLEAEGFEINE